MSAQGCLDAALAIVDRPVEESYYLLRSERLQLVDAGAGEQRADDLERGVLGGGADEGNGAVLDIRQDGVLLCLVEAVDLVDKQDRLLGAHAEALLRLGDDATEVGDAGGDGGDRLEVGAGEAGDDAGEGGLAGAGRSPEDHRRGFAGLDRLAEETALADDMLLADELVEGTGAHAGGEGGLASGAALGGLSEHIGRARAFAGRHYGHRLAQAGHDLDGPADTPDCLLAVRLDTRDGEILRSGPRFETGCLTESLRMTIERQIGARQAAPLQCDGGKGGYG